MLTKKIVQLALGELPVVIAFVGKRGLDCSLR